MTEFTAPKTIEGPFGPADQVLALSAEAVVSMYQRKFGADFSGDFGSAEEINLFRCRITGVEFWRPAEIAGNRAFYRRLSGMWDD